MLEYTDVGCWIVKADPGRWRYFEALDEDDQPPLKPPHVFQNNWTLGKTRRNGMIKEGDLIALWVTGPRNPGIYEFGWVNGPIWVADGWEEKYAVDVNAARQEHEAVDFAAVRLRDNFVPRPEMKTDSVLSGCEQFRAPQGSNPSYLDHGEARALAQLIAARVPAAQMKAAKWDRLLR